jgi:hypothetical protein
MQALRRFARAPVAATTRPRLVPQVLPERSASTQQPKKGWTPWKQRELATEDPLTVPPRKKAPSEGPSDPALVGQEEQVLEKFSEMQRIGLFGQKGKE